MTTIRRIEKEAVSNLQFVDFEVLESKEAKQKRKENLERAMVLGNNDKVKCRIVFETIGGPFEIETTIWHTTDNFIDIKGGVPIPVQAIREIILL